MSLPLTGVTVLDLSRVLTALTARWFSAISVPTSSRSSGFPAGTTPVPWARFSTVKSYCFAQVNRNKRSVALDLKDPRGA